MSGRGGGGREGRGRGGAVGGSGGRGQPQARGGGGGRSRGRGGRRGGGDGGGNAPPLSAASQTAPVKHQVPIASPVAALGDEVEKITMQASSSSQPPQAMAMVVNPPAVHPSLPPASSKASRNPARPGYGTVGRKVLVKANHFLVTVADRELTHYDVTISPEVPSKKVCRDIMNELVKSYQVSHLGKRMLAYDGRKSCCCAGELPFTSKDFVVKLVDNDGRAREREFKVSIKFASKPDLHHLMQFLNGRQLDVPQETLQFLDVVLRQGPSNLFSAVGRSFFHPKLGQMGELGNGLEYWKGFYQSLRPTQMGLSINIDMSARAFFEPIFVTDFVAKYLNRDLTRPMSDNDRVKLKKALKGVKVETKHLGHIKRIKICGFTTQSIQQLMFNCEELGGTISVAQYFRQKYGINLKYPFLPAIQSGSDSKPTYLPMEICCISEGQRYTKKLNERQVTALLKATCQRPEVRERDVLQMVKKNNYNADELVNREFGISVRPDLTTIEARVLPPPTLKYHDTGRESVVNPSVGQWNMINKKMVNGGRVENWACINFSRFSEVGRFCELLIDMCASKGMDFNPQPVVPIRSSHPGQIDKALADIHASCLAKFASMNVTEKQLQLLIIILPDVTGSYGRIKRICETELGLVSQCCKPQQASKLNKQYMENVSLKINVKVGGRNTVLEQALFRRMPYLSERPTIIFGADVTHPQPGEDSSPSIAAVVASMDWPEVTKYRALVSAQTHREEMIQDLYNSKQDPQRGLVHGGLIRDQLMAFYKTTRQKPHRIIFYRDGVSEGQFSQVLLYEMDAIRKACGSLEEGYMPKVTFVVVQKRHHTRFFPAKHGDRQNTDRSGNILPGTVVDTNICHPTEFDFYLCSHAGIQGTSRPTHYHVLFDENGFTADGLQVLTNNLCYTYARCTRSVSIVPPAYYAHLAAFRARYYIEGIDSESGSTSRGGTRERNMEVRALPVIKDNVKEVMFYC